MTTTNKCNMLTNDNCTLVFFDPQPQMAFSVQSNDRHELLSNMVGLAKTARSFNVPSIITTLCTKEFGGNTFPQIIDVLNETTPIERSVVNAWDDKSFRKQIDDFGNKNLICCGPWAEGSLTLSTLAAIQDGYDVFIAADASGGSSTMANGCALQRCFNAGAIPTTWQQFLFECQGDWSDKSGYETAMRILQEHGNSFGIGFEYASTMVHGNSPNTRANR